MSSLSIPPMAGEGEKMRYVSSEELQKHTTPTDLWIAIQGKVYDVTTWCKDHPGGNLPLLNLAGQDVTDAFVAFHPAYALCLVDRFLVGHLSDYKVSDVSRDYRRLNAEFSEMGLFEKKGHDVAFTFCFIMFLFAAAVYGVLGTTSAWVHLASGGVVGFLWIQSGLVVHDSGHYNVMTSKGFNRLAQILTGNCLTGFSIAWWKWIHNAHHIACNSLDYDPDLQYIPVFAVSHRLFSSITSCFYGRKLNFDAAARFFVSYQHLSFYPVMCVARVNLFIQTFMLLFSKRKVPNRLQEIAGIAVFWTWFPLLVSCLPNWGERVMFAIAIFVVTGIQHVQFCLSHFSSSMYLGRPRGDDWFEKQTMGTLDIACPQWMDWFYGGLQFQVEHHLFPRMPRRHLRKISPITRELCKKHNLTYSSASFWEANKLTFRTLRAVALQARDLANPHLKNLVWEAVNIHG